VALINAQSALDNMDLEGDEKTGVAILRPSDAGLRQGTVQMVVIMLGGLAVLALLERFGPGPADAKPGALLREFALVGFAPGFPRLAA